MVLFGITEIQGVVSPVDHKYEVGDELLFSIEQSKDAIPEV
jgi:hypothetical protein